MKTKILKVLLTSVVIGLSGCANYGSGQGGGLTGGDIANCGIGAALGLIVSNQVTDVRRSSNKDELKLASALAGCAAAPWATNKFESATRRAVASAAQTGNAQQIVWDESNSSSKQYRAVAEPVKSGTLNGRNCQQVRVSGVDTPGSFSDRYMNLCQTNSGAYEIVAIN